MGSCFQFLQWATAISCRHLIKYSHRLKCQLVLFQDCHETADINMFPPWPQRVHSLIRVGTLRCVNKECQCRNNMCGTVKGAAESARGVQENEQLNQRRDSGMCSQGRCYFSSFLRCQQYCIKFPGNYDCDISIELP